MPIEVVCTKTCFWLSLITEGQVIPVENEDEIPPSVRPFFVSKEEAKISEVKVIEEKADEIEKIQMELEAMGKPVDRRWGLAKLQEVLTLAKRDSIDVHR